MLRTSSHSSGTSLGEAVKTVFFTFFIFCSPREEFGNYAERWRAHNAKLSRSKRSAKLTVCHCFPWNFMFHTVLNCKFSVPLKPVPIHGWPFLCLVENEGCLDIIMRFELQGQHHLSESKNALEKGCWLCKTVWLLQFGWIHVLQKRSAGHLH